jgi:surface protein
MYFMFAECRALTSLDLSNFNTDNVTTMECMFLYCMGLTSVDLSGFTNARVTRTSNMFEGCYALTTIYVDSGWSLPADNYSYAMFADCTSLVGGMGTTYDENHMDAEYARIDGGPSNPGYFTEKPAFLRGDVDGDTHVDINDVTKLIGVVLGTTTDYNSAAADCDVAGGSGSVDINDVTALLNFVLNGHWN